MARETLESLRKDRDDWRKLFEQASAELSAVKKQLNLKVEETEKYQSMQKQVAAAERIMRTTLDSKARYKDQLQQRETEVAELRKQIDALTRAQDAARSDCEALRVQLQAQQHIEPHNARGAGRKPKITEEQREIAITMSEQGASSRKIAKEVGLSPSTVLRIIRAAENN